MQRETFERRLREASERARDVARELVEESLPDAILFRVRLNASYDGKPMRDDERVFPEDSNFELAMRLSRCSGEEVVNILWRDGLVPEWVDLSVVGHLGTATLIQVKACGRFTRNERRLYHKHQGRPPFHVLGVALPVDYAEGQKFSVYDRSQAWSRDELELIAGHASKVWSLALYGSEFDDETMASIATFDGLNILELRASSLRGSGLAGLEAQPRLRHFRLHLWNEAAFTAARLPELRRLETFSVENLPTGSWGFNTLTEQLPGLMNLELTSNSDLVLDGRVLGALDSCSLRARRVYGDPLPAEVDSLRLHLSEGSDGDVRALLAPVSSLRQLGLRGTPVSEGLVEELVDRFELDYLDVVDTQVGLECVERIRARYPNLRTYPNPSARTRPP